MNYLLQNWWIYLIFLSYMTEHISFCECKTDWKRQLKNKYWIKNTFPINSFSNWGSDRQSPCFWLPADPHSTRPLSIRLLVWAHVRTDPCLLFSLSLTGPFSGLRILSLLFADDMVLSHWTVTSSLHSECEVAGIRISTTKEAVALSWKRADCPLKIKGELLRQMEEFKYFGVLSSGRLTD